MDYATTTRVNNFESLWHAVEAQKSDHRILIQDGDYRFDSDDIKNWGGNRMVGLWLRDCENVTFELESPIKLQNIGKKVVNAIHADNCQNIFFGGERLNISGTRGYGINSLYDSHGFRVSNVHVYDCEIGGISIRGHDCAVRDFEIHNNRRNPVHNADGIKLYPSSMRCEVSNGLVYHQHEGIDMAGPQTSHVISDVDVRDCEVGVFMKGGAHDIVCNNIRAIRNRQWGFLFGGSKATFNEKWSGWNLTANGIVAFDNGWADDRSSNIGDIGFQNAYNVVARDVTAGVVRFTNLSPVQYPNGTLHNENCSLIRLVYQEIIHSPADVNIDIDGWKISK